MWMRSHVNTRAKLFRFAAQKGESRLSLKLIKCAIPSYRFSIRLRSRWSAGLQLAGIHLLPRNRGHRSADSSTPLFDIPLDTAPVRAVGCRSCREVCDDLEKSYPGRRCYDAVMKRGEVKLWRNQLTKN